ncbi:beta strand repeat-containing protein, partial [Undibacterium sp. Di27W]|uniref:beta strand repeat-containing protein n=1 Tax=Undibacterium sp. Di27W TaxID=3413036 RepID=UPI003BF3D727
VANATVGVSIDAGALTAQSALDVTLGRGANFLQLGAGADRVVLLGNYVAGTYNVTENGVNLNAQSTATAVARVVTDTINLGAGNDTLVTYGAINLAGAQISGVENITANSAVVITASQYAALVAARAALNLSGPVLTFSGNVPHQLTIVDDIGGVNNIDLSLISVTGGSLVFDVTSSSNATGGSVNNMTISNAITVSGGATAIAGVIGTSPVNGGGIALAPIALTAGGVFNSTANVNDNFTGNAAALVGTTINGNAGDTDMITFTGGGSIVIGGGTTITNIKTVTTDNTSSNVYFNVATSGVTTVNGGTGNDNVYLANSGNSMLAGNVNLGAGTNSLIMEGKTYTGTFTAGAGVADTLSILATANIAAANITGFENLGLATNGALTLTTTQYAAFTAISAPGTNTFTFANAGTVVANAVVENYNLANGTNTFTAGTNTVSVVGGTGADTFNYTAAQIAATTTLDGGLGADTLNIGAIGANLNISALVTAVETINVTGSAATGYTFTNENGAGVTLNYAKGATGDVVVLGTGGQTVNLLGTAATAVTVTGGTGADTINLSATATGAETITTGSVLGAIDTVANFKVAGADVFKTGTAATTLNLLSIATADTSTLAAAIATAATAAGAALAANTQAYVITVAAGTAAGTYAFQNIGGTVGTVDATDFIVKLVGAGSIVAADFIA